MYRDLTNPLMLSFHFIIINKAARNLSVHVFLFDQKGISKSFSTDVISENNVTLSDTVHSLQRLSFLGSWLIHAAPLFSSGY